MPGGLVLDWSGRAASLGLCLSCEIEGIGRSVDRSVGRPRRPSAHVPKRNAANYISRRRPYQQNEELHPQLLCGQVCLRSLTARGRIRIVHVQPPFSWLLLQFRNSSFCSFYFRRVNGRVDGRDDGRDVFRKLVFFSDSPLGAGGAVRESSANAQLHCSCCTYQYMGERDDGR